eukprot:6192756-Pleurochrysis_carterae.AAC.5
MSMAQASDSQIGHGFSSGWLTCKIHEMERKKASTKNMGHGDVVPRHESPSYARAQRANGMDSTHFARGSPTATLRAVHNQVHVGGSNATPAAGMRTACSPPNHQRWQTQTSKPPGGLGW